MKTIKNSEIYVPFYDQAVAAKIREELDKKIFIEVYLKGGRFSGKSYYVVDQILELAYLDPARSTVVIAMTLTDHQERGVVLFDKVLTELGLHKEWKWHTKKTRPVLVRNVNGYKQEIRFLSLADLETAGFEPPINDATGKQGYYGTIWADEMAKKTDNSPEADFGYISRLLDAVTTAKNTFIRHMEDTGKSQSLITLFTLNPWGEDNPIVKKLHDVLTDDYDKLRKKGYNLGYNEDGNLLQIMATTNFKINSKLGQKALDAVKTLVKEERAATMVWGMTGRNLNSSFGRELSMMETLNRGGNIPSDLDYIPVNMSMDVGTSSKSVFYLNGFDARYMVRSGSNYLPTRVVAKAEYVIDPKEDLRSIPERYKDMLRHIQRLAIRFPEIKKGITLYVDGSAIDTIELLRAYIKELNHEDPTFDLADWLEVIPQKDKWKNSERREERRDKFSNLVGNYALIVDRNECPVFYADTARIVSTNSEKLYDHCYDALMYGIMPLYIRLEMGIKVKAFQGKPTIIKKEEEI